MVSLYNCIATHISCLDFQLGSNRYRGGLRKVGGGARTEEKFFSDYTYDKVFCHNFNKCYNEI